MGATGVGVVFGRRRLPAWSPFEDPEAHREFLLLVRRELARTGQRYGTEDEGRLAVLRRSGVRLDLAELASAAADGDPHDWTAMIAGRVAAVLDPPALPADPDALRASVRVRLAAPSVLARLAGLDLVAHHHGGLVEVVVLDTPPSPRWGDRAELEVLGLDADELLVLGRENVRRHDHPPVVDVDLGAGPVQVAGAASPFVASWAPMIDRLVDVPDAGVVLGVGDLHAVLVTPLAGPDVTARVHSLIAPTVARFTDALEGVSPHLHLWRRGELVEQPVARHDDGSLGLQPTLELVEALDATDG